MAFSNVSRCGETGGGCVGRCGQTGTGRTLTARRRETVAVDSNGGNGMHGRYNSCSIGGRGFQGQAEMTDEDCAIGRWEQWAGFFDGS